MTWLRWLLGLTGTRPYPHVTTWLFRVGLLAVGALGNVAASALDEEERMTRRVGFVALAAFIATIWTANWLIGHFGVVGVGFGLVAPAGVYAVGVAFTLRDIAHRALGPWWVMAAIIIGAGLSYVIAPQFALASGAAFLVSELADLLIYTPLRERSWLGAVAVSNTVGLAVDSLLFLWLAFGSLTFLAGQMVGKAWMTLAAVLLLAAARRARGHLLAGHSHA